MGHYTIMKKILLVALLIVLICTNVYGKTIWCNPANISTEDGTTKVTGWTTLWEAITDMAAGDTPLVVPPATPLQRNDKLLFRGVLGNLIECRPDLVTVGRSDWLESLECHRILG